MLIDQRDRALAALSIQGAPLDSYVSLIAERDPLTALAVEPWTEIAGGVGGLMICD